MGFSRRYQNKHVIQQLEKSYNKERVQKWLTIYNNYEDWTTNGSLLYMNFRQCVSKGIPHMLRPILWAKFLKLDIKIQSDENSTNYFNNLVNGPPSPYDQEIRKDINRSLPNCTLFTKNESNYDNLYNVLKAYSIHNKDVGFCQSMAPVVSFLLTVFNSEKTFWALDIITEQYFLNYYTPGFNGLMDDCDKFEQLIKIYLPLHSKMFSEANVVTTIFCLEWFSCLFVRTFPEEICLLIWDQLLFYGKKFLMQVSLAILDACFPIKDIPNNNDNNSCNLLNKLNNFIKNNPNDLYHVMQICNKYSDIILCT